MNVSTVVVIIIIAIIFVFAGRQAYRTWTGKSSCCGGDSGIKTPKKVKVADTDEANYPYNADLKIGGMTCEKCVQHVQNALNSVDGTWARVDLDSKSAHVLSKSPINLDAYEKAVEAAGYYVARDSI